MDEDKQNIIDLFNQHVKGKVPDTISAEAKHAGKEGHWLEEQMGVARNASNSPDLFGYEMKNATGSKTTFGDWSADFYIWNDNTYRIQRDDFLQIFGKSNLKKGGRFSWSGEPVPEINQYNTFGQILLIDRDQNIIIEYSHSRDHRPDKASIVPTIMQQEHLLLARWDCESIKQKVERKFNQKGWFKCQRDESGTYTEIVFGAPITFEQWLADVKKGQIIFDSGMYQTNTRNYSQWRAVNSYWENLITDRH
jgi:hypothetical protein